MDRSRPGASDAGVVPDARLMQDNFAPPEAAFEATVNGRKVKKHVPPFARLLDVVRNDIGLTGTKEGCGAGECGTCSVFVDGVLVKSLPGAGRQGQGRDDRDGRGLAKTGELSVLQQAFHKTAQPVRLLHPRMVIAATSAIRANPSSAMRRSRSASAATFVAAPDTPRSSKPSNSPAT